MAQRPTRNFDDYITDYETAHQDYQEMGPLWAEMVFGDDFEALRALYGGRDGKSTTVSQANNDRDNRSGKRR